MELFVNTGVSENSAMESDRVSEESWAALQRGRAGGGVRNARAQRAECVGDEGWR